MTLSEFQEEIVKLFLRLNGYTTSSLIVHSEKKGNNKTQIDLIAIRFPFHSQEDRVIKCSEYLQIPPKTTDIIIGEVKGGGEKNQFNSALRDDNDAIEKLVKWIGILPPERCDDVVKWLREELRTKEVNKLGDFPRLDIDNVYSIRPIVFNLDSPQPKTNQKRFVYGDLMTQYIWDCLRPDEERESCSTTYPLNMWGHTLTPIVEYFKNGAKSNRGAVSDLYKHFNLN